MIEWAMAFLWNFVKKHRFELIIAVLLTLAYFFLRLYRIMSLPIFTDEAIYIRWSQIARFDASWRFISLIDGKQPLFIWLNMTLIRVIHDPLLSGRLISVFAGFATMAGLFFFGREIFKNRWIGILSAFLYLIFPFSLVYDRMALYDSLVGTFAVWSFYFEILLIRRLRLDTSLILGMVLGGGILTKTSGFFSIYLMPFLLLIFEWKSKKKLERFLKFAGLALISIALAYGYYLILRLSPFFSIIGDKNANFVYPIKVWLMHPFTFFIGNIKGVFDWLTIYLTWPIFVLIIASFLISPRFLREKLILLVWFLIPFVAIALFGRILYPRFILFMAIFLLPLAAFSIYEIFTRVKNKYVSFVVVLAFLLISLRSDYLIIFNFAAAPIPKSDLGQYINDWPAGGGTNQIIDYLNSQSKKGKIFVVSLGTFGSLPTFTTEIYLGENKNVEKKGYYPIPSEFPQELADKSKKMPVYLFFSNQKEFELQIKNWPLLKLMEIQKGKGEAYSVLYKIIPQ